VYIEFAALAFFALLYSLVAGRLEQTPITGPIVFLSFGLLVGPLGFGWLDLEVDRQELRILADMTLALVLFIDAANADMSVLRKYAAIPLRMLLLGLPMTIGLGMLAGMLLFDQFGFWELAVLATMLTATDAALGKAVITNKAVPARIREALNVESGLNDGICVPLLFVFIILAEAAGVEENGTALVFSYMLHEIGIGLIVGLGITAIATWLMRQCWVRGWITEVWEQIPVIMLAILCFTVTQSLGGSGYIAAFSGGILFGILTRHETHKLVLHAEGLAETLAMITWVVVGAFVIDNIYPFLSWSAVAYAVLSLTIVRMLPVFLCLTGTGETATNKLFLGWFGPRGFASIVFGIIVLNTTLSDAHEMAIIVVCTVVLSALAHGLTANPLAKRLFMKESQSENPE
jgi:NhaP-type Na+/H+ or K+/H+ antiporter